MIMQNVTMFIWYDSDFDVVLGAEISTEDLSKTKDSVAEMKQVDKVVD
jgi:hypothetical protein